MNRLISIGLSIAVAPAILLAIGNWIESRDMIRLSEAALFYMAIPLGGLVVMAGLLVSVSSRAKPSSRGSPQEIRRCPICNASIPKNVTECGNCGAKFGTGNRPPSLKATAFYQKLVDEKVKPESAFSKYGNIALIQVLNIAGAFYLLMATGVGGDQPERAVTRAMIIIYVVIGTTIGSLIMRRFDAGLSRALAFSSIPIVILLWMSMSHGL